MFDGKVDSLIDELDDWIVKDEKKIILGYFRKNRQRMLYGFYREKAYDRKRSYRVGIGKLFKSVLNVPVSIGLKRELKP